jgi:catechol 2,3-dioxygenase-like lactoylglutathione lyase family enzyme
MLLKRITLTLIAGSVTTFAQQATSSKVLVVESFTHVVEDAEKEAAFYREVVGLEVVQPLTPFVKINWVNAVGDTPGAEIRIATFRAPGSPLIFELAEYRGIDRKPAIHPSYPDPGVTTPIFYVRDFRSMVARLKQQPNLRIMSAAGGKPAKFGGDLVWDGFFQDEDGLYFSLTQHDPLPETTAPASSNVVGESFEFIPTDLDKSLKFYNDLLGFGLPPSSKWIVMKGINDASGIGPGAAVRTTIGPLPGRSGKALGTLRYLDYKDTPRTPIRTRLQDPGSTVMRMSVRDLAGIVKEMKAAGVTFITKDGEPVNANSSQYVMVRDPDNIYLDLVQHDSNTQ